MNEFDYIKKYFKPLTSKEAGGLEDDAAIFRPKLNKEIVISTDSIVEGIHFFGHESPSDIAKKCLRVNLSDMAAMGAKPLFYNLALNIPKDRAKKFISKFVTGLKEDQEFYGISLIGGDLTSSLKHAHITITIFGEVTYDNYISRNGAQLGDALYVTGHLGLSKIGLDNFFSKSQKFNLAKKKYLIPEPRIELSLYLNKFVNCMIDISDGLIQDATHLAINSNLSIELDLNKIPLPNLKKIDTEILLKSALYGGDDYELLFSCNSIHEEFIKRLSIKTGVTITKIGLFKKDQKKIIKFKNQKKIPKKISYSHF